ncbi:MAG: protein TolR [Desulfobacterales bacterium]
MLENSSDRFMADINVTPFVDVMLVLLIIFMVTAPMMMQGLSVSLPETTAEPLVSEKEHLMVTIDKDSKIYINDYPVTPDFLKDKLKNILAGRSEREVYLRADKTIPYGLVVYVMSQIKGAGVDKLGMVTVPPDRDKDDRATGTGKE